MYLIKRLNDSGHTGIEFNALYRLNNYLNDVGLPTLTTDGSDILDDTGSLVYFDKDFGETISIYKENKMTEQQKAVLENLRQAIQDAEEFGIVRTESGQVITGAVFLDGSVVLTED